MNAADPHPSFTQLAQLLDDEGPASPWGTHVAGCTRCGDRLEGLRAQAHALQLLARSHGVMAVRGTVLGAARDAGWACVRRLLRELVCACARLDVELAPRVARLQLARPVPRVLADVTSMARRLAGLGVEVDLDGLPDHDPAPDEARATVRRCLHLLSRLEPPEDHALLLQALGSATTREEEAGRSSCDLAERPGEAPAYQPTASPSFLDSLAPR
jgi:hypothetical protein